jgi:mRNA interferase MazF
MSTSTRYKPRCGDIVWIDFNPQTGHEQAGRRPALVLSDTEYNATIGLALLCPITSKTKGYPFEVPLPDGLKVSGFVLADQAKSFDWRARDARFICEAPGGLLKEVLETLLALLPE